MKNLKDIISEKLIINKNTKIEKYHYYPNTNYELWEIIQKLIGKYGDDADLNEIDTSKITDMAYLFSDSKFNGDISEWDVSNVKDMTGMFEHNKKFNGDISKWDVSKVKFMKHMFDDSPLEKNPPKWYKN